MFASSRSRLCLLAARQSRFVPRATYTSTAPRFSEKGENLIATNDPDPPKKETVASQTNTTPVDAMGVRDGTFQESTGEALEVMENQAPNRKTTWSRNQQERKVAMSGPRFEQTMMDKQPQPYAAIDLIHKQPVRWTHKKVASCDGGGGPLGHPRIFINTDKPEIHFCEYCGLPFANEHNRKAIETKPRTSYPLEPLGDPAEVNESQRVTDSGFEQR